MNSSKVLIAAACAGVLMTACGGHNDPVAVVVPPVTEAVPAEAATSPAVATQYVADLSAAPADTTDTLEPIATLPDSLASDDTAEPKTIE
jgi:hypothetical protein